MITFFIVAIAQLGEHSTEVNISYYIERSCVRSAVATFVFASEALSRFVAAFCCGTIWNACKRIQDQMHNTKSEEGPAQRSEGCPFGLKIL